MTRWSAVLCAVLLMISLFAVPVFADAESTAAATAAATEAATESATDAATESATAGETTTGTTASTGDNASGGEKDEGLSVTAIIWIVLGAVIVVVLAVLGIKYREKVAQGLRTYKSEFKKVSWLSWEQTRKSTFVVVIILVAFALVIGLLDMGLLQGFQWMLKGFTALFQG